MTRQEFDLLQDIEKEEIVLDNGRFLSTHHFEDTIFDTYQLGSFYVQFYYDLEGNDKTRIITFPYFDEMFSLESQLN